VSVINTATNAVIGSPITVGNGPFGIAIKPNQGPVAGFSAAPGGSPKKRAFSAAASADSDGTVARYDWDFGDGVTLPNGGATPSHTYAADGPYSVSLTVTDNEGCSDQVVFTGTTASCNGSAEATSIHQVDIDSVVDGASLSAKKTQKQKGKKIAVTVKLGAAEAVHVVANGKIKIAKKSYALKKLTKSLAAGGTATVKLKLKKTADAAKVAAALRQGTKVTASPVAKFTDDAGNSTAKRKTVRLK
jgi:DNA-binding beta-propeller fold protein YncE